MIKEALTTPLLLIALDNLSSHRVTSHSAISIANSRVTQEEILSVTNISEQFKASDMSNIPIRIPIPINDRLLPIHFKSAASNSGQLVDYFDDKPVFYQAGNSLSLQFEIENSLSLLTTVASIFMGLTGSALFTTKQPRVSFFSPNVTIFNAYFKGISRNTLSSTTKEIITLQLEVAPSVIKEYQKKATPIKLDGAFKNSAGV